MEIAAVQTLARQLMAEHGVSDWALTFDHARRRAGMTDYRRRTISFSKPLMLIYPEQTVRDVILHEIAHALVGPQHAHDAQWKRVAARIGATARASLRDTPQPEAPWVGVCPRGHRTTRYRRPTRPISCAQCARRFDPRFQFTWYFHGQRTKVPTL